MKTDRLIDVLSTNLEPVRRWQIGKVFTTAVVGGAVAALLLMVLTVGLRPDLTEKAILGLVVGKLAIAFLLVAAAVAYLMGLVRPGQSKGKLRWLIWVVLVAMVAISAGFALRHATTRTEMISSTEWALCLICIPLFATIPFAALVWALRQGAPTRLKLTGMLAGLGAGGVGAAAYALHCPIDAVPFTLTWYGVAVAICALIGAVLGPRLLRW